MRHPYVPVHQHHVQWVQDKLNDEGITLKDLWPAGHTIPQRIKVHARPYSTKTRTFQLSSDQKDAISALECGKCPNELHPETIPELAPCNNPWKETNDYLCEGTIYLTKRVQKTKVFVRKCTAGCHHCHYDGTDDGIFNYSGGLLFSEGLLYDYIYSMQYESSTWTGFKSRIDALYSKVYNRQPIRFVSKTIFIKVITAFIGLLDPNSWQTECSICGKYPSILFWDGTDLGFPKRHIHPNARKLWDSDAPEVSHPDYHVVKYKQRILLPKKNYRLLLQGFATGNPPITEEQFLLLKGYLQTQCPSLFTIIDLLHKEYISAMKTAPSGHSSQQRVFCFPGRWKCLFTELGSFNSLMHLIHPKHYLLFEKLAEGGQLTQMELRDLSISSPLLAQLTLSFTNSIWPEYARNFLKDLLECCRKPYESGTPPIPPVTNPAEGNYKETGITKTADTNTLSEYMKFMKSKHLIGHYWPFWPRLRQMPHYPQDKEKEEGDDQEKKEKGKRHDKDLSNSHEAENDRRSKHPQNRNCRSKENDDGTNKETENGINTAINKENGKFTQGQCLKRPLDRSKERWLTPGILIATCRHGVPYGFHIMFDPEGRKDVFSVLYERMPEEILANLTVIYDFGCQLSEYILNREPNLFKWVIFFVDKFHKRANHKCKELFDLDSHPIMGFLNSSTIESLNSYVQHFRRQVAGMKQETAMLYIAFMLALKARSILEDLY